MMNISHSGSGWSKIQPHLDHALELEPARREAWLADLETTQPQVVRELRAMLAQRDALSGVGFLHTPLLAQAGTGAAQLRSLLGWPEAAEDADSTAVVPDAWQEFTTGQTIGPYQLIRSIGHGGMSSVWLATRYDGQLKREVALKLPFVDSRLHLELFERERDVLAALTHPQIARLYDAGISAGGQPYLAMEYVEGTALPCSCQERRLDIRERLQLFLQVLEAVQFAHSALIIHRDLKPSNILVTPQGRVVLLDFGISKLLTEPSTQATRLGRALTPDYASPEQIAGRPLGTTSDIYSLGVILYELLTGLRPYRLRRTSQAALEEAILDGELRSPSMHVLASGQMLSGARRTLARSLSGDLDTIVLKALKKTPAERYASVSAFAQDIENYLQGLPVSAQSDSFWYRARCFVARHKGAVAVACAAVLLLVSGSLMLHREAARDEAARRQAEADRIQADVARNNAVALAARYAAVTEFLGRLMTEAPESLQPLSLSEMLIRGEQLVLQDSHSPPETRAAVLEVLADYYWNLSDDEHAGRLMAKAVALLAASSDRALRTRTICKLAVIRTDIANAQQAIEIIMREVAAPGVDPQAAAECLLNRALIDAHLDRAGDMLEHSHRGLQLIVTLPQPNFLAARLLGQYAYATHLNGRSFEAEKHFERALSQFEALGREHSQDAVKALHDWAVMLRQIEPRRALEMFERSERLELRRERRAAVDPMLAINKASALQFIGRFAAARSVYEAHCGAVTQRDVVCLQGLAEVMLNLQQPQRAAEYLLRAAEIIGLQPLVNPQHLTQALFQGRLALLRGQLAEAERHFDFFVQANARVSAVWRHKSQLALARGDVSAAAAHARRALQLSQARQQGFPYSWETGHAWLTLGHALRALGEDGQAAAAWAAAVENLASTVDAKHPQLIEARRLAAVH